MARLRSFPQVADEPSQPNPLLFTPANSDITGTAGHAVGVPVAVEVPSGVGPMVMVWVAVWVIVGVCVEVNVAVWVKVAVDPFGHAIFTTTPTASLDTYRFPNPSDAMPHGLFNCACVAIPPIPAIPAAPVPAIVLITPDGVTILTLWLPSSEKTRSP